MLFLMILIGVFTLFAFGMAGAFNSGLYMLPFTIVPITVLVFLDSRTAFYAHLTTVLLSPLPA